MTILAFLADLLAKAFGKAISDWAALLTRDAAQRRAGELEAAARARDVAERQEAEAREAARRTAQSDDIDPNDPFLRKD